MSFTYEASGRLCLSSWTKVSYTKQFATKFGVRDSAWSKKRALRGVLDEIVVKRVEVVGSSGVVPVYLYVDTFNSLWREDMLLTHAEAMSLATDYYVREMTLLDRAIADADSNSCSA
jgi:hypothetical protein